MSSQDMLPLMDTRDPMTCPYAVPKFDSHVMCELHGTWVVCQTGYHGDPPMCAYEEPDNSDEARERRLAWMKRHTRSTVATSS